MWIRYHHPLEIRPVFIRRVENCGLLNTKSAFEVIKGCSGAISGPALPTHPESATCHGLDSSATPPLFTLALYYSPPPSRFTLP